MLQHFVWCSYGEERTCLVGQLGYKGSMAAAYDWGAPLKFKTVTPAAEGASSLVSVGSVASALDATEAAVQRAGCCTFLCFQQRSTT
jgi:hypothetical protein